MVANRGHHLDGDGAPLAGDEYGRLWWLNFSQPSVPVAAIRWYQSEQTTPAGLKSTIAHNNWNQNNCTYPSDNITSEDQSA